MNKVRTLLRQATRDPAGPFNILTFPTHERYESQMCECGHNFYSLQIPGHKQWETDYAPIPANYTLLQENIPGYLDLDMILSQSKQYQFEGAQRLAEMLSIPLVSMQHTLPPPGLSRAQHHAMNERSGDIDVFVSEEGRRAWGYPDDWGFVNPTGIDLDVFQPSDEECEGYVITVVNDFVKRDAEVGFQLWVNTVNYPNPLAFPTAVLGKTPGFSRPAKSIEELVQAYGTAVCYLNTTLISSLPTVVMEAMACGIPVVTTGTCDIENSMVKHGYNGFVSKKNDPMELRSFCNKLIHDTELRETMGRNARAYAIEHFSVVRFAQTWDTIFKEAASMRIA